MNNRKQQEMNSSILAGDMVREIASHLNNKDFKNLRNTCRFFAGQTYTDLVNRVRDQQSLVEIKMGAYSTVMLKKDGTVWFTGTKPTQTSGEVSSFTRIEGVNEICQVAAGEKHYLYLKKDGSVWVQGSNLLGQIGLSKTEFQTKPTPIPHLDNVCQISSQANHSLFLKKDGTVWGCGLNANGQLGVGNWNNQDVPVQIPGLTDVCQIHAGFNHSIFMKKDGSILTCGSNEFGQLGLNISALGREVPTCIPNFTDVCQIATGCYHTLFLKKDGTVWGAGKNDVGQLGSGNLSHYNIPTQMTNLQNVTQIGAGCHRSMCLTKEGTVYTCGNKFGATFDQEFYRSPVTMVKGDDISRIILAHKHAYLLKKDGSLLVLGNNSAGQLGLGDHINRFLPTPLNLVLPEYSVTALTDYHKETETKRMRL